MTAADTQSGFNPVLTLTDVTLRDAALSAALATIFRGKLCDTLLRNRSAVTFEKDQVIYEVGDKSRTFFFIRSGFVKVGTLTEDGHEVIYDIRNEGDVAGELCACKSPRPDRAVALEQTEVVPVAYSEILDFLQKNPDLVGNIVAAFCDSLSDAYEQVNTMALDDTLHRTVKVLLKLAAKLGRHSGQAVEIATYLTQEEIAKMVAARREKVSIALNLLRRRGLVQYSRRGHLLLDVKALENYEA